MGLSSQQLRTTGALLLLSMLCLQRVIGVLGIEVSYVVDHSTQMSFTERMIAANHGTITGVHSNIKVLTPNDRRSIAAKGYAAPLVCAAEIDGEVIEYTFAKTSQVTIEYC